MRSGSFLLFLNTIRFLKFRQIIARIMRRYRHLDRTKVREICIRSCQSPLSPVRLNKQSYLGRGKFVFLNETRLVSDWNDPDCSALWLYNLHYFDDLNSENATERQEQHAFLIDRWIRENPVLKGDGWEAYPLSLRIVNWVKWLLLDGESSGQRLESLALQAKILAQSTETHLLGNHLFANAKALLFAGLYFEGDDADKWLGIALDLLKAELPEQILSDGGNFELTPMYHSIITADLFDILSLLRAYADPTCAELEADVRRRLPGMLTWLAVMTHPDGQVSFLMIQRLV